MIRGGANPRCRLQVTGQANLDRDALTRDILCELLHVTRGIIDGLILDFRRIEKKRSVTDSICVADGDRLENRFRTVGFTGMYGLFQEMLVGVCIRPFMGCCRIAGNGT